MDKPVGDASGLAYLKLLNPLLAKQVVSLTEMITTIPSHSKYGIFNEQGEQFIMHLKEVIRVKRQFKCCSGYCCCACCSRCQQEVVVEAPVGNIISYVTQQCSFWRMHYDLKDANQNVLLKILGPDCICDGPYSCCCENKFTLLGTDGSTEIGAIHKKYRGFLAEACTNADTFTIQFPIDMDVRMKAIALSALFLIDFSHFAEEPRRY